jgi:hypothetical protein
MLRVALAQALQPRKAKVGKAKQKTVRVVQADACFLILHRVETKRDVGFVLQNSVSAPFGSFTASSG